MLRKTDAKRRGKERSLLGKHSELRAAVDNALERRGLKQGRWSSEKFFQKKVDWNWKV